MVKKMLFVAAMLFVAVLAVAQDAAAAAPAAGMDWTPIVNSVVVALIPAIIFGLKRVMPSMPRVLVWTLPFVLGGLLSWVTTLITAIPETSINGILLGALAMVLRELVSTLKEHGVNR